MNKFRLPLIASLFSLCCFFSSCKKITEDNLINGLWLLNTVNIDTSTVNYLTAFPHYNTSVDCCQYKMDFEKDGTMLTFYLTHDTLHSVKGGTWYVTQYKQVYINVDDFIDGTFVIEQPSIKKRILTCDKNHLKIYDGINPALDTTYTKLELTKI